MLDGNGIKAMPGSISAPNSGSFENKKNTGNQMGFTKKIILIKKNRKLKVMSYRRRQKERKFFLEQNDLLFWAIP